MMTKVKWLVFGIAFLVVSAGVMALFFENLGNKANQSKIIRVACVGDSITEGSGYPAKLQQMLGSNYEVGNFGVSGSAVLLTSNKPYMNQTAFLKAKEFQPHIVVVMLGTNDAEKTTYQHIENFSDTYKKLVTQLQALKSIPQIWLVEPPPILGNQLNLSDTNLVNGVIPRIVQVADEMRLPTIDMYRALISYNEFFGDGVHPSSEGADLIAMKINNAITSNDSPVALPAPYSLSDYAP